MASSNIINALTSILEREEGPFISKEKILSLLRKKQLDEEEKLPNQPELPDEGDADLINRNNKVLWSIKEVTITIQDEDTEDSTDAAGDGSDRPKKKKSRKEHLLSKKNRNDPNAPALNRIPLPELRDSEKIDKQQAIREVSKRLKLGPETLPSVCFYTLLNGHHHHNSAALCAEISEDSRLMAAGFSDSSIRVWALAEEKLKGMRTANELETLDKESDDVTIRMMDTTSTDVKILRGHNGPVYNVSFSLDRTLLLSCSEDSTGECKRWKSGRDGRVEEIEEWNEGFFIILCLHLITLNLALFDLITLHFIHQFVCGVYKPGPTSVATKVICLLFGMSNSAHMATTLQPALSITLHDFGLLIIINLSVYLLVTMLMSM